MRPEYPEEGTGDRQGSRAKARSIARALALLAALCVSLLAGLGQKAMAGDSLRCGSRIVSIGQDSAEVQAKCGQPAYLDTWSEADTEVWYYNHGSSELIRVLRFKGGRLAQVDTDGYGFAESDNPGCAPADIVEGMSVYRLYAYCGPPRSRRVLGDFFRTPQYGMGSPRSPGFGNYYVSVHREEWTYDFGSGYFVRRVKLENGCVVDIENGDRGSEP